MIRKTKNASGLILRLFTFNSTLKQVKGYLGNPDRIDTWFNIIEAYEWLREIYTFDGWKKIRIRLPLETSLMKEKEAKRETYNIKDISFDDVEEIQVIGDPKYEILYQKIVSSLFNKEKKYNKDLIVYVFKGII